MSNFNYTPLNNNRFKSVMLQVTSHGKKHDKAVQLLALDSIYAALVDNNLTKAEQVIDLLRGSDKRRFSDYVCKYSNLSVATKEYKEEYKLLNDKPFPKERDFIINARHFKHDDSVDVTDSHARKEDRIRQTMPIMQELQDTLWTAKIDRPKTIKPINALDSVNRLLKRKDSESYVFADETDEKAYNALNSFMGAISSGKTLTDLEIEIEAKLRSKILEEMTKKSNEPKVHQIDRSVNAA